MKRHIIIVLAAACFCLLLSGCLEDDHYYGSYGYDSIERFMSNCASYDVDEYFRNHYTDNELFEMLGKEAIMDHAVGAGWVSEWVEEQYEKEVFRDGFLAGYDEGYEIGYQDGQKD